MKTNFQFKFIVVLLFLYSNLFSQIIYPEVPEVEHILKLNESGELACQSISIKENQNLFKISSEEQNYTLVRSTNNPESVRDGFKIILRATDQLMNNPEALLSFRRAAAVWERYIDVDITTIIDVDFGVLRFGVPWDPGVLGSTGGVRDYALVGDEYQTVSDVVELLKANHAENEQLQALYDAIPVPTPSSYGTPLERLLAPLIYRQMLGYQPAHLNPDDYGFNSGDVSVIGFNANFQWDLDPNDGIDSDKFDFDGTVVHEIGHAIGFSAGAFFTTSGAPNNFFLPWDLFRVRPDAVEVGSLTGFSTAERVTSEGPPDSEPWPGESNYLLGTQVYFDQENKWECSTGTGAGEGGDGSQASHWRDDGLRPPSLGEDRYIGIMDPNSGRGDRDVIHYADLRMLEVIGFKINYTPTFAAIEVAIDGTPFDITFLNDTLIVGDVDLNTLGEKTINITNNSTVNSLWYEVELVKDLSMPDNLIIEVSTDKPNSEIAPGNSEELTLHIGNVASPGIYYGTLRLHTNDEDFLVVEIPFEANFGGAIAPTVTLSAQDLGELKIESNDEEAVLETIFNISNSGNIPLEYRLLTSLSTPSIAPVGLMKTMSNRHDILSAFYSEKVLSTEEIIYETDFETDLGGFVPEGDFIEDWNRIETGYSELDGHTKPTALYYGNLDSMKYQHQGKAAIVGQPLDLSNTLPEDMVVLAFNYFLKAEIGFDFAFVDVSIDGGESYQEVATSNGGIILEQTTEWQSVVIELPEVSGNPEPVVFRFRFESDQLLNDEGFYIDDISVNVIKGVNSIYTSPRAGLLANQNDSEEITLSLNSDNFSGGYYTGNVLVISNDVKQSDINLPFLFTKLNIELVTYNKLYGSTARSIPDGNLVEIDITTGEATATGKTGLKPLSGLTINTATQEIIAISTANTFPGTKFIKIDAENATALIKYETTEKINSIAFNYKDNQLYGVDENNILYKIESETGELTEVGDVGLKISAITFNPFTKQLYGSVGESSDKDRIYRIDITSADTILVGKTGLGKKIEDLAFDSNGNLYGVQGGERQISTLIKIDLNNGEAEEIGSTGIKGIFGLAFAHDPATAIENEEEIIPTSYSMSQSYPNPFNPTTTLKFGLMLQSRVTLEIYDVLGRRVEVLLDETRSAGNYEINFDATNLTSGVYFYRINAQSVNGESFIKTMKMVLMK